MDDHICEIPFGSDVRYGKAMAWMHNRLNHGVVMKSQLEELKLPNAPTLELIGKLRVAAWKDDFPAVAQLEYWLDDHDAKALHWVIIQSGQIVAAARLNICDTLDSAPDAGDFAAVTCVPPAPIGIMSKLVVDPRFRRMGFSKRLVGARLDAAERHGCRSVIVATSSDIHRVNLLNNFNFEIIGYRCRPPVTSLGLVPRPGVVLMCRLPGLQPVFGIDLLRKPVPWWQIGSSTS